MPPLLTWKQMLWTGVVLTAVGLLARTLLASALVAIWGLDVLTNPALYWVNVLLGIVAFELGLALVAFSLVARAIAARVAGSAGRAAVTDAAGDDLPEAHTPARPRASVVMLWTGVVLAVLGLLLQQSLDVWATHVSAGEDVSSRLATDLLTVVGLVQALAFPFGILLVAGSLVVRCLETASVGAVERMPR